MIKKKIELMYLIKVLIYIDIGNSVIFTQVN